MEKNSGLLDPDTLNRLRGSGHPNKYLQADLADVAEGENLTWFVRLETLIPIEFEKFEQVRRQMSSKDPAETFPLAEYLITQVPQGVMGAEERRRAQHMVAAAFGFEFPGAGDRRTTRS
jgi:hypothetical protein